MYCTNCGQPRPDNAVTCPSCGAPVRTPQLQQSGPPVTIPNHLVQSVIVTLCCCLPLGVIAIVNSARVDTLIAQGDVAGAQQASKNANMFAWIGVVLGILGGLGWGFLQFVAANAHH